MPKIRKAPANFSFPQANSKPVEIQKKSKNTNDTARYNSSLSETRAGREGYDYGEWRKHHDNGKHNGWGKGGKKDAMETLEAELQRILEEQAVEAQEQAQQAAQEEIKLDEVKQEQIQDVQQKEDLQSSDEKSLQEKEDLEKYDFRAENIEQNAPKEVKTSNNKTIAKTFQIQVSDAEHKTPSFTGILLKKENETEIKRDNQNQ